MRPSRHAMLFAGALFAACARTPTWTAIDLASLTPAQQAQRTLAEEARDRLAQSLLAELTAALGNGGPAAAIDVCRSRAPAIAAEVAAATDVTIGRCSAALRNPANAPPAWATAHVAANLPTPAAFASRDGHLGVLSPIRLMPLCVQCHGKPDAIDAATQRALQQHYPTDHATGFAPGDLRGWFWVEVPASH